MFYLILFFLGCAAGLKVDSGQSSEPLEECATIAGRQICDFYAIDKTGNEVLLSDLYGQPVVLDLSAGWCGPCITAASEMQSKAEMLEDVTFLTVLIEDAQGAEPDTQYIMDWQHTHGIEDAPIWGSNRDLLTANPIELKDHLFLTGWPTFYFIDSDGKLSGYLRGYDSGAVMQMAAQLK
ncbi:MAG: hypothetical protein CBB97_00515 [Candidatus Endolissoclinum sp. TMED37]|nr:MAG: hypothetical protein CBB97_00515 [Candidatus Endolissoclinum sp. TMED37]|tara:strand:- start:143 stop:682 length:540 start_codon:yes stop_codon:yes gene_type:complete